MAKKRGASVGRPPLPPDERLSKQIVIRMTEAEYEQIERAANGMPIAPLVREVLVRWAKGRRR